MNPLSTTEQLALQHALNEGVVTPACYYCNMNPCYEITITDESFVRSVLVDERRLVCKTCWDFMAKSGAWVTQIIRFMLKLDVILKKRRYR